MKKFHLFTICLVLMLTACAPTKFVPREMPKLEFQKTPYYKVDLENVPKPEAIKPIFVDENFKLC